MKETKEEKPLAGSTTTVQDSKPSLPSMKDGEEPDAMLLALLWSPLATLIERKRVLLATAKFEDKPATVIILVGTKLLEDRIEFLDPVGTANKEETDEA